jgi:plasmid replication initiation protein
MDKVKGLIVYKPNELIEIVNRPISAIGLKVYNAILQKLQDLGTDRMTIPLNEIIIDNSKNYEDIYSYLDELQKVQVKSIDKRGKSWGSFVLLSEYKKTDKGIFVAVPPSIHNALCGKDKKQEDLYYTAIKLLEEKSFKCSYSLIFYEIFKRYEKVSIPVYTIEDLRQMTKTENKYKVYYEFKRRVLNPALKEINSFNPKYTYDYEEVYIGRKVDKIRFTKTEKTKEADENTKQGKLLPALSEKLLKAIEKAKKNRYVQEKYSQRAVDKALKQFGEELLIKGLNELYKYNKSISSFSKILNAKIDDIKRAEEVKKQGTNIHNVTEEAVKTEIIRSENLENKKKSLDELIKMTSAKLMTKDLSADKKINLCKEILKVKSEEELKEFCDKHDILLNLELF